MKKVFFGLLLLTVLCFVSSCFAADDFSVSGHPIYNEAEKSIQFLINDNRESGQSPNIAAVSVDGSDLSDVSLKLLRETDVPITFVFVVDTTSTSYPDQKRRPMEIADALTSGRSGKNDEFYLISFNTVVNAPEGPSKYPADILEKLDYSVKGMSDYTEALKKAIDLLNQDDGNNKKVIILISDGYLEGSPSIDVGDLIDELTKTGYSVYANGLLRSESNKFEDTDLKKLSDISTRTGGLYFSDTAAKTIGKNVVNHIEKSLVVNGTLPESYFRESAGDAEAVIRLLRGTSEMASISSQVSLPAIGEAENETDIIPTTAPDSCDDPENPDCEKPSFFEKIKTNLEDAFGENWILVLIAGSLLIVLIILVILTVIKRNKEEVFEEFLPEPEEDTDGGSGPEGGKTEMLPDRPSARITLDDMTTRKRASLVLQEGENKVFGRLDKKNPKNGVVVISIDDAFISRNQFMISLSGGKAIIKDLGSQNGTYLNGERISGEVVLQSGSKIRIGDVPGEREFTVTIARA